jgi:hypothetical protein
MLRSQNPPAMGGGLGAREQLALAVHHWQSWPAGVWCRHPATVENCIAGCTTYAWTVVRQNRANGPPARPDDKLAPLADPVHNRRSERMRSRIHGILAFSRTPETSRGSGGVDLVVLIRAGPRGSRPA